jgi:[protein-PII] uridylyltransferase
MPPFAVIATGGYGRCELAPWSDVDLTVVPLNESHPMLERAIKLFYRELHDTVASSIGMRLGYALRHVADCPSLDPKTRSGLIDARFVVGCVEANEALTSVFWPTFPAAEFVIEKIEEQRTMEARTNDTPYATQPELKHGAGGLRSFQAANWIGAAIGERMSPPGRDYDAVVKYRNLLHLIAERPFDTMTHAKRQEVSDILESDPFEIGSALAGSLASLQSQYIKCLERLHDARFALAKNVETIRGEARIAASANVGQAATGIANATKLGLRVTDTKAQPTDVTSASEALAAVSAGETTLRNLDRSGVLEVLLPELTACRTVIPRDSAHDFTVFEHTLRVIRNLDSLAPDTFLGSVAADLRDRAPIYLAALLHDVGRAEKEDGHDLRGSEIASRVCERWGMYETTKDTVCWLVREHLSFDRTLRMRDVFNPETAIEFAKVVGTPERLAMLALLTWADINAVNAHAWTLAQESFLKELYQRTLTVLGAEDEPSIDTAIYRRRLLEQARSLDVAHEEYEGFLDSMPALYLTSTDSSLAHAHFGLVRAAKSGEPSVVLYDSPEMGCTDVTVCCLDASGLLSRILGVLYSLELSIVAIRASTTDDELPVALDTITVSFGGRPVPASTAARLVRTLTNVLSGEQSVEEVMRAAKKDPDLPQNVLTTHYVPGDPGIIEIQAPRGRGMAYRLARQLSAHGINILSARVGQWAGTGTAAFYVSRADGGPLDPTLVARALEGQKV